MANVPAQGERPPGRDALEPRVRQSFVSLGGISLRCVQSKAWQNTIYGCFGFLFLLFTLPLHFAVALRVYLVSIFSHVPLEMVGVW